MRLKTCLSLLLPLAALFAIPASARAANDIVAEAQVRDVIERFRAAIIAKDGDALRALFLPAPHAWVSVDGEARHARAIAKRPDAKRLRPGSYQAFAEDVETSTTDDEEVFSDIDIRTDGAVATVVFDFVYLSDGKEGNRGLEAWQLVKSDNGWKIVSLIYSNQVPP